uniref:Uncharacterized protein MANES_01G145200 n=1 Tax=Rhizophora mucronata TaxID=61149 RepID=A0A2P2QRE6_RHIMU
MGSTLSVIGTITILQNSIDRVLPPEIRSYLWELSRRFSSEQTRVVPESHEGSTNDLFKALPLYLGSNVICNPNDARRLTVGKHESMKVLTFGLDRNSEIVDTFHGVPMKWTYHCETNNTSHHDLRWYELRFHKQHADMVNNKYLLHVLEMAETIKNQNKVIKLYTTRSGGDGWSFKGRSYDHPMTFETLAIDGDLKQKVRDDLDRFITGRSYYRKIGRVWKRGYLLYGPPGTGKSSFIAAVANHLNFDIYNLNLANVLSDSMLEYLLLHMSNRSILVVEDIDCSIVLQNRQIDDQQPEFKKVPRTQVTLSGLLNAIDGLLSCCGNERIIIFTTNFKDRLDPALVRAGRMDMHIELSYCTFSIFKQLVANYLEIADHDLFCHIEKLIKEVQVSPADVAGELMKRKDPEKCLEGLIRFLESRGLEMKALNSPLSGSQVAKNMPEEGCNENLNQQKKHQVHSSCETPDLDGNDFANQNGVESAASSASLEITGYTIVDELAPILNAVFSKYGDIGTNCSLQSVQCRSSLLDVTCRTIQKLQSTELKNFAQGKVKSMLSSTQDLESVGMEVGWLRQQLEIIQAMLAFENVPEIKENRKPETSAADINSATAN